MEGEPGRGRWGCGVSDAPRMPLEQARKVVAYLAGALDLIDLDSDRKGHPAMVVGSVRRQEREVGDLEFIAPMPTGCSDPLFEVLASRFGAEGAEIVIEPPEKPSATPLFHTPKPGRSLAVTHSLGEVVKGLKPRFRYAAVVLKGRTRDVKIEFYRYDDGPGGNRGWVELVRTGCADFGFAVLTRHKAVQGIPKDRPGSDTYLLGADGAEISTPTEQSVFDLVGIPFIEPPGRTEHTARNILNSIGRKG